MTPPTASLVRRAGAALGTAAGLGAATVLLAVAGRTLPFPADLHPSAIAVWADDVGAPAAAFTLLRALAVALVGWCTLAWVLGVVARVVRRPAAVRLIDRLSLPVVRRLADAAAGLAVVGASLSPVAVAAAPAPTGPDVSVVMMTDLGPAPSPPATTTTTTTTSTAAVTVPDATSPPDPATHPALGTTPTTVEAAPEPSTDAGGPTWIIGPGDTLWHVAEQTLAAELGRAPSGAEVLERLDRLVAVNLDRLAVPGDPGLVFPGQEFLVP